MNYYIQGNKEKADQIKAAFEKLGIDVLDFGFADKTLVYCSIGGCVQCLPYSINLMHILYSHPDYQELELPIEPKFKVGDWVVSTREPSLTYRILESNVTNELGELDYKVEIYSNGIYEKTCFIASNKMDEWGRLWTIKDAKDGDVLVCYSEVKGKTIEQAGIFKQYVGRHGGCSNAFLAHTGIDWDGNIIINGYMGSTNILPATKEQRDLLFAKMKEAGYQWDDDKKELRKIQPHYDISNFYAGMPVLVRDYDNSRWSYVQFSHYVGECGMKFNACGIPYIQCIPFEGNKHLLGTTDMPDEMYINW